MLPSRSSSKFRFRAVAIIDSFYLKVPRQVQPQRSSVQLTSHLYQPLGRIMNRFSKDIDTLDNVLGEALRQFLGTAVQVVGSIILVSIIIPWFLIAIAVILLLYYWIAIFYRASARELRVFCLLSSATELMLMSSFSVLMRFFDPSSTGTFPNHCLDWRLSGRTERRRDSKRKTRVESTWRIGKVG